MSLYQQNGEVIDTDSYISKDMQRNTRQWL